MVIMSEVFFVNLFYLVKFAFILFDVVVWCFVVVVYFVVLLLLLFVVVVVVVVCMVVKNGMFKC